MENQCTVQVKLELGHRAQLREKPTPEGFTHDWVVFVRGPGTDDIQHFVEKVVFRLHDSFPQPKRVCKEPPYEVEESGCAGFLMPIEVHFKNKEKPKKVCFNYDLFLNLEGNPPVNHLRCEMLTFNNPTKEFRRKLIKAGGVFVVYMDRISRRSHDEEAFQFSGKGSGVVCPLRRTEEKRLRRHTNHHETRQRNRDHQCKIQVNLKLGHTARQETSEDYSHEWAVFVRGSQSGDIQQLEPSKEGKQHKVTVNVSSKDSESKASSKGDND